MELELLICGGRELNLEALEAATLYDDGYTPNSQVWDVDRLGSVDRGVGRLAWLQWTLYLPATLATIPTARCGM